MSTRFAAAWSTTQGPHLFRTADRSQNCHSTKLSLHDKLGAMNRSDFFPKACGAYSRLLVVVLLIGLSVGAQLKPAQAATIPVTNTNNSGAGSLRQAILSA